MRRCTRCRGPIRTHAFVAENVDYCGKNCYCAAKHRGKKVPCRACHPIALGEELRPKQPVERSRKKIGKLMKRKKTRRLLVI